MSDGSKTAFVFPGQASQVVGMGKDIASAHPAARAIFDEANSILGYSISQLCFEGPETDLNDTYYTQPALYVCSLAMLRAFQSLRPGFNPAAMAGHSLGELTAFAAAGAYSFADGLRLVQKRGQLMREVGERTSGAMAAVIGLDAPGVAALCERAAQESGAVLVAANDNCPGQIVVSGDTAAVNKAVELGKSMGAKLVRKLAVSIASHSPLMQEAGAAFASALEEVAFQTPEIPVYANITAAPVMTEEAIRHELAMQLTSPVRWTESIMAMAGGGVKRFIEVGPRDVLTSLVKRIDPEVESFAMNDATRLQEFADAIA